MRTQPLQLQCPATYRRTGMHKRTSLYLFSFQSARCTTLARRLPLLQPRQPADLLQTDAAVLRVVLLWRLVQRLACRPVALLQARRFPWPAVGQAELGLPGRRFDQGQDQRQQRQEEARRSTLLLRLGCRMRQAAIRDDSQGVGRSD